MYDGDVIHPVVQENAGAFPRRSNTSQSGLEITP